jgi:hypothetical protein
VGGFCWQASATLLKKGGAINEGNRWAASVGRRRQFLLKKGGAINEGK